MTAKSNIQLDLSEKERSLLRQHKISKSSIVEYAPDELAVILESSLIRAKELRALTEFQQIPSIGIAFAKDLVCMGYYNIEELKEEDGAVLRDRYEKKKGYRIDSCVEDQFRLAVHFAKHRDYSKRWYHFTKERKLYRESHGYPKDRPRVNWTEIVR